MSNYAEKDCKACGRSFKPNGARQVYCGRYSCAKDARELEALEAGKGTTADAEKPAAEAEGGMSPFDVVDAFGLDYFLGNVVRFVLEHDDGDELENLRQARTYLDEKIGRLERAAS
jgi:hypothetical protein